MRRVNLKDPTLAFAVFSLISPAFAQEPALPNMEGFRKELSEWLQRASATDVRAVDTGLKYVYLRSLSEEAFVLLPLPGVTELTNSCAVAGDISTCGKYNELLIKLKNMDPQPFKEARATEIQ